MQTFTLVVGIVSYPIAPSPPRIADSPRIAPLISRMDTRTLFTSLLLPCGRLHSK